MDERGSWQDLRATSLIGLPVVGVPVPGRRLRVEPPNDLVPVLARRTSRSAWWTWVTVLGRSPAVTIRVTSSRSVARNIDDGVIAVADRLISILVKPFWRIGAGGLARPSSLYVAALFPQDLTPVTAEVRQMPQMC